MTDIGQFAIGIHAGHDQLRVVTLAFEISVENQTEQRGLFVCKAQVTVADAAQLILRAFAKRIAIFLHIAGKGVKPACGDGRQKSRFAIEVMRGRCMRYACMCGHFAQRERACAFVRQNRQACINEFFTQIAMVMRFFVRGLCGGRLGGVRGYLGHVSSFREVSHEPLYTVNECKLDSVKFPELHDLYSVKFAIKRMDRMTLPKYTKPVLWVLCVLVALVSLSGQRGPLPVTMPHVAHYLVNAKVALYGHIIFAPLALLLMPLQFMSKLRARRRVLHKTVGRIYVASIVIAGVSSVVMLPSSQASLWANSGFAVLAVLWIGFTIKAMMAARAGDIQTHQRWMLRSATLTFAAVTLRLIMLPLVMSGWTVVETYDVTAWGSWVPTLIFVELQILRKSSGLTKSKSLTGNSFQ